MKWLQEPFEVPKPVVIHWWSRNKVEAVMDGKSLQCDRVLIALLAYAESSAFLGICFCVYPIPFVWGIRKFNSIAPQLPKIEAIQTSLFVDVLNAFSAMIGPLSAAIRFRIVRLLLLHWQSPVIVEEVHCCSRTMYSIRENIFMYSSSFKSQFRFKEIPCKMFKTAENNLIVYLEEQSWTMQKEIIWYIWKKWSINVLLRACTSS